MGKFHYNEIAPLRIIDNWWLVWGGDSVFHSNEASKRLSMSGHQSCTPAHIGRTNYILTLKKKSVHKAWKESGKGIVDECKIINATFLKNRKTRENIKGYIGEIPDLKAFYFPSKPTSFCTNGIMYFHTMYFQIYIQLYF